MNIKSLSMALRNKATELSSVAAELGEVDATTAQQDQILRDASELICVLARMGEGKPMNKAFGAPGDWGYETPIGQALAEPTDIPDLDDPVDQDKLIEQYRVTCEAQQRAIERMRDRVAALEKRLPIPFVMRFAVLVAAAERAKQERQEPVGHIIFPKRRKAPDVRWADNTQIMEGAAIYAAPPVTAPVRLTDEDLFQEIEAAGIPIENVALACAIKDLVQDAVLRANGFDIQPAEAGG